MTQPPWADRILNDGEDRESWMLARRSVIGASDAAKLAKPGSVPLYLADKLRANSFTGNDFTRSGHRWEPMLLAWADATPNKALIHSPGEIGFAATPDGYRLTGDGVSLAECKAKHGKPVTGPTLAERRQIAWQFLCIPEAYSIVWVWAQLDGEGELVGGEPRFRLFFRIDRDMRDLMDRLRPIATDLLTRLRASLQFEKELA